MNTVIEKTTRCVCCFFNIYDRFNSLILFNVFLGLQTSLPLYAILMDFFDFDITISSVSLIFIILGAPWLFQFIPAILSDIYSVNGYHRKPYMIVCNLFAALTSLILSQKFESIYGYIMGLFLYNLLICISQVNYNACNAEDTKKEEHSNRGCKLTKLWIAYELGSTTGNIVGAIIWNNYGSPHVYYLITVICALCFILAISFKDNCSVVYPSTDSEMQIAPKTNKLELVKKTMCNPIVLQMLIFNYIYFLFPGYGIPIFYYVTGPLEFSPYHMSQIFLWSGVIKIAGECSYTIIRKFNLRNIYILTTLGTILMASLTLLLSIQVNKHDALLYLNSTECSLFDNLTENALVPFSELIGLNSFYLVLSDAALGSTFREIKIMLLVTVVSVYSNESAEASTSAFARSGVDIVGTIHRLINGLLFTKLNLDGKNFEYLYILVIICMACEMLALILSVFLIPPVYVNDLNSDTVDVKGNDESSTEVNPSIYTIPSVTI